MKLIYLHIDKEGNPFYVGKGNKYRTYDTHNRSSEWYIESANGFTIKIIEEVEDSIANEREMYWISKIGRRIDGGTLINKTKGGKGKLGNFITTEPKIHFHKRSKKWVMRLQKEGKRQWLGSFNSEIEAIEYKNRLKI